MKLLLWTFFLLALATVPSLSAKAPSKFKFRFINYSKCTDHNNTAINFEDLFVNRIGLDDYELTGKIDVTEDIYGPLYMGAKIETCGPDQSDDCVHFADVIDQDLCEELKNENSNAFDLMNNTFNIPDPKCPLLQYVHEIHTKSVDMSQYEHVVEKGKRWKVELMFYKEDRMTVNSCLFLEILIEPKTKKERNYDKKNWQKKQKEEKKAEEKKDSKENKEES